MYVTGKCIVSPALVRLLQGVLTVHCTLLLNVGHFPDVTEKLKYFKVHQCHSASSLLQPVSSPLPFIPPPLSLAHLFYISPHSLLPPIPDSLSRPTSHTHTLSTHPPSVTLPHTPSVTLPLSPSLTLTFSHPSPSPSHSLTPPSLPP